MDRILLALVDSSHPIEIKTAATSQIVAKVLMNSGEDEREQILSLVVNWIQSDHAHKQICGQLAVQAVMVAEPRSMLNLLNARWLADTLQNEKPTNATLIVLQKWLSVLHGLNSIEYSRCCSVIATASRMYLGASFSTAPGSGLLLAQIWHDHPPSAPPFESLSPGIVHMLAAAPTGSEHVTDVVALGRLSASLLSRAWGGNEDLMFCTLADLYETLLSISAPNMVVAFVLHGVPFSMIDRVTAHVTSKSAQIGDEKLINVATALFPWLKTGLPTIHLWILGFLRGFASANRFTLLVRATDLGILQVCKCLYDPCARLSAMDVLQYMLLSYQHSPQAFHTAISALIPLLRELARERPQPAAFIDGLSRLCHTMMYKYPGYPLQYTELLEMIDGFSVPTESEIQVSLRATAWAASRDKLPVHMVPRAAKDRVGLFNLGNTCYLNSVLQALFMSKSFRAAILAQQPSHTFASTLTPQTKGDHLQALFAMLLHSPRSAISPKGVLYSCTPPWFSRGVQQDSDEQSGSSKIYPPQLKFLLEALEVEEKEQAHRKNGVEKSPQRLSHDGTVPPKNNAKETPTVPSESSSGSSPYPPATQFFVGDLTHQITCLACRSVSRRDEPFTDLPLPLSEPSIPHNQTSLPIATLMQRAHTIEMLSGDDMYFCDSCGGKSEAEKRVFISKAPDNLVLKLNRFAYDPSAGAARKLLHMVTLDPHLSLQICDGSRVQYQLFGVIFHAGKTLESGHYFCCAAADDGSNDWYMFNDSTVSRMTFEQVQQIQYRFSTDTPYMLFLAQLGAREVKAWDASHPCLEKLVRRDGEVFLADLGKHEEQW